MQKNGKALTCNQQLCSVLTDRGLVSSASASTNSTSRRARYKAYIRPRTCCKTIRTACRVPSSFQGGRLIYEVLIPNRLGRAFSFTADNLLLVEQMNRYPIPSGERIRLGVGIQSATPEKPVAVILGQGLWNDLDVGASAAWLDSVLEVVDWARPSRLSTLLVTPNAAGKDKDDAWLVSQGNKALVRFEESMAIIAGERGIDHLGTWNMVSILCVPNPQSQATERHRKLFPLIRAYCAGVYVPVLAPKFPKGATTY
jgi:hypothetical protein